MRLLWSILSASLLFAPQVSAQCKVTKLTSFDARLDSGRIVIDALIDGQHVSAMLDTGLPFNMISKALAEKLKLPTQRTDAAVGSYTAARRDLSKPSAPPFDPTMMDAAGGTPSQLTTAHMVSFGELNVPDTPFFVMGEPDKDEPGPDVIFGANFLERYDLELDPAHGKVNIFFPDHCPGRVVYWSHKFTAVPMTLLKGGHIVIPIAVNGTETHASLDTGAKLSMVSTELAEGALGIDPAGGGEREYVTETSGASLPFYRHTFDSLDFGGIQFLKTSLGIAPDRANWIRKNNVHDPQNPVRHEETINAPVTLGMKHLDKLRLYFAFQDQMLYITAANADLASQ